MQTLWLLKEIMEDYIPPTTSNVYKLESTLPQQHTRSMRLPTISSDTELASDRDSVHSEAQPTPEKSNLHQPRWPRKPKTEQIVVICMLCTCTQPGHSFIFVHGVTTGPLDHRTKKFSIYTKFWFLFFLGASLLETGMHRLAPPIFKMLCIYMRTTDFLK